MATRKKRRSSRSSRRPRSSRRHGDHRLPFGWADWDKFERSRGKDFIEWVGPPPTPKDPSQERYAVVRYHGSIRWARVSPSPDISTDYSSGAFYDDMPGGAVAAAARAAKLHQKHILRLIEGG
jgi:hypothetical protein